ncbi:hypothetical protein ACSXDI_06205 [Clostridium perfringens]|uniref:hypothetical protein n=1 Tax=Clostridium perfringens TaxID=1502 RepID=UPI001A24BE9B|nr:hypothetical protein [Clostridium perfringens]
MKNVLYINHNFGILSYKNKLKKFKSYFDLKDVNNKYCKNDYMIVKLEGKILVAIITDDNFRKHKNKLNDYFYS